MSQAFSSLPANEQADIQTYDLFMRGFLSSLCQLYKSDGWRAMQTFFSSRVNVPIGLVNDNIPTLATLANQVTPCPIADWLNVNTELTAIGTWLVTNATIVQELAGINGAI